MRWAALLKGVNVGGNRKLPMADLKALVESLGYTDVKTLLASGNVVFTAHERSAAKVGAALEHALAKAGVTTDVLVRSKAQLEAVLAHDPFPRAATHDPSHYLVIFHREPFPADLLATLINDAPRKSPPTATSSTSISTVSCVIPNFRKRWRKRSFRSPRPAGTGTRSESSSRSSDQKSTAMPLRTQSP